MNEFYSLNLSREVKKGLYENFEQFKHVGGIRDLLKNEKYIGTYTLGKKDKHGKLTNREKKHENAIPAILDIEMFYSVQNSLKGKSSQRKSNAKVDYLLTGFCKCGECGSPFSGEGKVNVRNKQYDVYSRSHRKSKKQIV